MATIDIILAVLLAYGLIRGVMNGFFLEFASVVSLFAGIYIATKFSAMLASAMASYVSWNPVTMRLVAFLILFLAAIIGVSLLARIFTSLASFAGIGILNRILGAVFGLMKVALIAGTLLALMSRYGLPAVEARKDSVIYEPITTFGSMLYPSLIEWIPKQ